MLETLVQWIVLRGVGRESAEFLLHGAAVAAVVLLSYAGFFLSKYVVFRLLAQVIQKSKTQWDDIILKKKLLVRLARLVPPMVFYAAAPYALFYTPFMIDYARGAASLYMILVGYFAFSSFFGVLLDILRVLVRRSDNKWDDTFLEKKVFSNLARQAPALVIYVLARMLAIKHPSMAILDYLQTATLIYVIVVGVVIIDALLSAIIEVLRPVEQTHRVPIRPFLQALKVISYFLGIMLIVSLFTENAWKILGGLGGLTAVMMLVFKDALLGFVSGIQLSMNKMVVVGDWIEMPKFGADGDVVDITLTTVKVQNFDKTVSTIPTYALMSNSFKNWRGMFDAEGRRIKRSIHIDLSSVKFCTAEMLERFARIQYITEYIETKKAEVSEHNAALKIDTSDLINGRHLTNIGTFRAYLEAYLRNHPMINQDMTFLIRQLEPTDRGLPMQIYVFCCDQRWAYYEAIQADIFDHIFAVLPEFELRLFQSPCGSDVLGVRLLQMPEQ